MKSISSLIMRERKRYTHIHTTLLVYYLLLCIQNCMSLYTELLIKLIDRNIFKIYRKIWYCSITISSQIQVFISVKKITLSLLTGKLITIIQPQYKIYSLITNILHKQKISYSFIKSSVRLMCFTP